MLYGCFCLVLFIGGVVYSFNFYKKKMNVKIKTSPYLSLYKAEFYALYSILQRLTGIFLLLFVIGINLVLKARFDFMLVSCYYINLVEFLKGFEVWGGFFVVNVFVVLVFHILVGVRYIYWIFL